MDNFERMKALLKNIENLDEEEKHILKQLLGSYKIYDDDEYMELYNQLSFSGAKALVDIMGHGALTGKFLENFKYFEDIIPSYNINEFKFFDRVFKSDKLLSKVLECDEFYKGIQSEFTIKSIFKELQNIEYKKTFISNCLVILLEDYSTCDPELKTFIKNYIDDSIIIEYLKDLRDIDQVIRVFAALSDDEQDNVYHSDWFQNKVDLNDQFNKTFLMKNCSEALCCEIAETVKNSINFLELYDESKPRNLFFLKMFLERFKNSDIFDEFYIRKLQAIYIITNKIFDSLGDEYQKKLDDFINNLNPNFFLKLFFENYVTFDKQSNIFKEMMYNRAKEILESTDFKIDKLSPFLIKTNDEDILKLIVCNVSKEDLLMLSIRNEYIYNYTTCLLNDDPNYFEGVTIANNMKFKIPSDISNDQIQKYLQLFNYLTEDQYSIFFISTYLERNDDIKSFYKKAIKNNPNILGKLSDLKYVLEDIDEIIQRMDISKLISLILYDCGHIKEIADKIRLCIDKRTKEIIAMINDDRIETNFDKIPNYVQLISLISDKESFINSIKDVFVLCFALNDINNKEIRKLILKQMARNYNAISYRNIIFPRFFDDKEEQKDFTYLIDFDILIKLICEELENSNYTKGLDVYIDFICKEIDKDINKLFDSINSIVNVENILKYLPNNYQNKVKYYLDEKFNELINLYPDLKPFINTYVDKANFVNGVLNNIISDRTISDIQYLLEKNRYLFNSMDFNLLNEDISKMGEHFIEKTSRYPLIASKITKIYQRDKDKFNLILLLSHKIYSENTENIYDQKIEKIINYLYSNNINIGAEVDNNLLTNIENYILENSLKSHIKFIDLEVDNYIDERKKKLDLKINECNDLLSLKNYIYLRYFWLSYDEIYDFLVSYVYNWDSVLEFAYNDLPNEYIGYINGIWQASDIDQLRNLIKILPEFTLSDQMTIKGVMIQTYNKAIISDLNKNKEGNTINLVINGKKVEAIDKTNQFSIFAHSTGAYGEMPMINDDYYDSWNYNPHTDNHGICSMLITEHNYGTTVVKGNGVMLGFYNIDENAIPLMAPYDLATVNDGYNIVSYHNPFFGRISTISDYTRHTHNESTIERRKQDIFKNYSIRQPDAIIIFEDMSDEIKQNSLKAYEDFALHGVKLEIIYIDRVKLAKNNSIELEKMIKEYKVTFDLDLLKSIINLYESNICSCDYLGYKHKESLKLFDQHKLFYTDEINEILNITLDMLEQELDSDKIAYFVNIMNAEQFKFDLIKDFNEHRRHQFELYTNDIKARITKIQEQIKVKQKKIEEN